MENMSNMGEPLGKIFGLPLLVLTIIFGLLAFVSESEFDINNLNDSKIGKIVKIPTIEQMTPQEKERALSMSKSNAIVRVSINQSNKVISTRYSAYRYYYHALTPQKVEVGQMIHISSENCFVQ